jgi:thymidylate synthase
MESLWMLAGRGDAAFLNRYVKDFGERFAESDGLIHGAYGKRWRSYFWYNDGTPGIQPLDQLKAVLDELKRDPMSRRVVIQMWDAEADLGAQKKDLPCNTHVYPRVRFDDGVQDWVLDITVCCRSNDIIWGAYGANAVHFSVLQEYLAAGIGVKIGIMYQISNNFHAYVDILSKQSPTQDDPYASKSVVPFELISNFASFDAEVSDFVDNPTGIPYYKNEFLADTAYPMARAYDLWRAKKQDEVDSAIDRIRAPDWALACRNWMKRRMR